MGKLGKWFKYPGEGSSGDEATEEEPKSQEDVKTPKRFGIAMAASLRKAAMDDLTSPAVKRRRSTAPRSPAVFTKAETIKPVQNHNLATSSLNTESMKKAPSEVSVAPVITIDPQTKDKEFTKTKMVTFDEDIDFLTDSPTEAEPIATSVETAIVSPAVVMSSAVATATTISMPLATATTTAEVVGVVEGVTQANASVTVQNDDESESPKKYIVITKGDTTTAYEIPASFQQMDGAQIIEAETPEMSTEASTEASTTSESEGVASAVTSVTSLMEESSESPVIISMGVICLSV